jgi:drug/metabolite transporter (DMT)-like permease
VLAVCAIGAWYFAILDLPLATAYSAHSTGLTSIVAGTLAARAIWALPPEAGAGAMTESGLLLTSGAGGFLGLLLLLRPDLPVQQLFAGTVGLLSGVAAGLACLHLIALLKIGEPAARTHFYSALSCTMGGAIWTGLAGASTWSWQAIGWILLLSVSASVGEWCITRACAHKGTEARAVAMTSLQSFGILFAGILGVLVFHEQIAPAGLFGITLIVGTAALSAVIGKRATG